ncbi:MAG: flagellar biosynthesis protein FliO [Xanthobacteraceae bacterium]
MSLLSSMPFPIQFFLAFLVVLGLIAGTAWVVRRFGTGRIGTAATRGRQPRLGVVDHASVDSRRRLLIIRRDNVEHLVMVGGPTDVVVETNIVRGAAATRDLAIARVPAGADTLSRAIPLPDSAGNGSWPLQPEPAAGGSVARFARSEPEEPASWPSPSQPEAPARANRETLTALHDELSSRPVPLPRSRQQTSQRPPPPEPRMSSAQPSVAEPGVAVDQSLAEMAHRLEAALRKPTAKPDTARDTRPIPMPRSATPAEEPDLLDDLGTTPPRAADTRQPNAGKMLYDSLEQEMASLLGRPTGKN